MTRQTVFDILGDRVQGARVLDLCAGAGTLGIEALSRGARECVFVDSDRDACSVILSNLEATGLRGAAQIKRAEVLRFLSRKAHDPFDLAFVDPPYSSGLGFVARITARIATGSWLAEGGTVVVEAEAGQVDWPPGFRETRTRTFGRTQVSMAVSDGGAASDLSGDV